jgi:hypothetical protein
VGVRADTARDGMTFVDVEDGEDKHVRVECCGGTEWWMYALEMERE